MVLKNAEAQLANQATEVASQVTRAEAARTAIASAQVALALAIKTRMRLEPPQKPGYISAELDQARTSEKTARTTLEQRLQQATEARQSIVSTNTTEAEIATAKVSLQSAERDLRLTVVRAPGRGRVTALSVAAGEYAKTGSALFTIIDTQRWWAVGNLSRDRSLEAREGRRRQGLCHERSFSAAPRHHRRRGVRRVAARGPTSGGLPDVPRRLNRVRIAQRFPVRVLLDKPPPELMRIGASVVIIVNAGRRAAGS